MIVEYTYGLWSLVIINSLVFIIFAFCFVGPKSARDWRSFGAFSAFLIALFTEMYGFPLTIFLLSGWLSSRFPEVDFFSHDAGHLLEGLLAAIFGWDIDPHAGPFHIASYVLIFAGFVLLARSWGILYEAQRRHEMPRAVLTPMFATRNTWGSSRSCWASFCNGRRWSR